VAQHSREFPIEAAVRPRTREPLVLARIPHLAMGLLGETKLRNTAGDVSVSRGELQQQSPERHIYQPTAGPEIIGNAASDGSRTSFYVDSSHNAVEAAVADVQTLPEENSTERRENTSDHRRRHSSGSDTSKANGNRSKAFRRAEQSHLGNRLFELHNSLTSYAGLIVTLALVTSAGLMYWLILAPPTQTSVIPKTVDSATSSWPIQAIVKTLASGQTDAAVTTLPAPESENSTDLAAGDSWQGPRPWTTLSPSIQANQTPLPVPPSAFATTPLPSTTTARATDDLHSASQSIAGELPVTSAPKIDFSRIDLLPSEVGNFAAESSRVPTQESAPSLADRFPGSPARH